MSVNLEVKLVSDGGRMISISVDLTATIEELKEQIASKASLPKENIRLVSVGKIWKDATTVGSYQPRDGAIVHCLNNPPKAAPSSAEQTLTPANPMSQMPGFAPPPAAAANSNDPFAQMMAQSQQMMANNPEMMQQMMDSPMVQQMMSNPETLRAMMTMNPRMNELMEQRPEIARMLEDPDMLRQSMQMMRNPSLMREAQRNADLAIGRLDVMPGGHNALTRAHEEMIDPVMSALSGSGGDTATTTSNNAEAYSQQAAGNPNDEALPNPWGPPAAQPAATPSAAPAGAPAAQAGYGQPGAAPALGANPFGGLGAFGAAPNPAGQAGANPMAAMMQQMMSNPALMGGMGGMGNTANAGADVAAAPNPLFPNLPAQQPGAQANPMAAMMQQMMSNPALMQQSMQMAAQMQGGQNAAGGAGAPAFPGGGFGGFPAFGAMPQAPAQAEELDDATARVRFASQLTQLSGMGFSNEEACLNALRRHQGRIDAAIDTLLSSPPP